MPRNRLRPRLETPLPLPPASWFQAACSVTARGELVCLHSTADIRAAWRNRRIAEVVPGALGQLSVFDGSEDSAHVQFELEVPFPVFDRRPDGRWIISNSRCYVGEENARLLAPDGVLVRRLCLGDGIGHLQCDTDGDIWVGYYDEGIFGNYGWGRDGAARRGRSASPAW